jgi:hypothetical protein
MNVPSDNVLSICINIAFGNTTCEKQQGTDDSKGNHGDFSPTFTAFKPM